MKSLRMHLPNSQTCSNIAQVAGAITGLVALLVVGCELQNLQAQNEILNRTLKEGYRPVGSIGLEVKSNSRGSFATVERLPTEHPDRFRFRFSLNVFSIGNGIVFPYAVATHVDQERTRGLLSRLVSGELTVANLESEQLLRPLPPGDAMVIVVESGDLVFADKYYFSGLFVYRDIADSIYATEYLLKFEFEEPMVSADKTRLEARVVHRDETWDLVELSQAEVKWITENLSKDK